MAGLLSDLAAGLPDAATALLGIAGGVFASVLSLMTLGFVALFLLMERPTITDWLFGFAPPAVEQRWRPVLESVLPRVVFIGAAGQAMVLKLVANLLVALNSAAAAEALSMAERAGLDVRLALEVLAGSAASSRMLEVRGPMITRREFPPQMKLDLFMKDLHLIQEAARAVGAPLPLTDVAERLFRRPNGRPRRGRTRRLVTASGIARPAEQAQTRPAAPFPRRCISTAEEVMAYLLVRLMIALTLALGDLESCVGVGRESPPTPPTHPIWHAR